MNDFIEERLTKSAKLYENDNTYLKHCPNCGAPIEGERCQYCGTYFIDFAAVDADAPFYMKIKKDGKVLIYRVFLESAEVKTEYDSVYGYSLYDSMAFRVQNTELNLSFKVI